MSLKTFGIIGAIIALAIWASTYTVQQYEKAILFQLGEIKRDDIKPGLHFKLPFLNNVRTFDARILTLDAQPERFLTVEKKNVRVDFFVKWRIDEVGQYFRATRGEESNAENRLAQIIKDGLRNEFGRRTIRQAVSGERREIMDNLEQKADVLAKALGIRIVDVRISQINLPDEVSDSVYQRMSAERERVAKDFRARGLEVAEKIRAEADRERTVILANAYRDAEQIRGDGDARAAELYAGAYGKNPEFYSFYRSLNAYREAFSGKNDMLILDPGGDFFRYFNKSNPQDQRQPDSGQAQGQAGVQSGLVEPKQADSQ
ncbi:MAG: protease modulator HflC [Gammaproteobacteria bacterium]